MHNNQLLNSRSKLSDINDSVIEDFITSGLDEGYTIELKDYTQSLSLQYDIRQIIASFANRQGGFLLIGVKDKKNVKSILDVQSVEKRITGLNLNSESRQWIDEICGKDMMQPIAKYEVNQITIKNKNLVIVKVYAYSLGPIGIKKDASGLLEFWHRGNGSNLKMDYISIVDKFETSNKSIIEAAFVDIVNTYGDIELLSKSPICNNFTVTDISSIIVEERRLYYGIFYNNCGATIHINNLRRTERAINNIINLCNTAHQSGVVVNNEHEIQVNFNTLIEQFKKI